MRIKYVKDGEQYTIGSFQGKDLIWETIAYCFDEDNRKISRLVLLKDTLSTEPFHKEAENATWNNSTLRKWLNNTLYKSFSDDDKQRIILQKQQIRTTLYNGVTITDETEDYIFILSPDEMICCFDEGIPVQGKFWLRTGGTKSREAFCYDNGTFRTEEINSNKIDVRPAMWVMIETEK